MSVFALIIRMCPVNTALYYYSVYFPFLIQLGDFKSTMVAIFLTFTHLIPKLQSSSHFLI